MKKHILGLAMFGVIFGLTALGFAYFLAPQIPFAVVKEPQSSDPLSRSENPLSSKIETIQYELESGNILSTVKLKWTGRSKAPERIYVRLHLFSVEKGKQGLYDKEQTLFNPFQNGSEAEIPVKFAGENALKIDRSKNLYALVDFSTDGQFVSSPEGREDTAKAQQVLFVHSKLPVEPKTVQLKAPIENDRLKIKP